MVKFMCSSKQWNLKTQQNYVAAIWQPIDSTKRMPRVSMKTGSRHMHVKQHKPPSHVLLPDE